MQVLWGIPVAVVVGIAKISKALKQKTKDLQEEFAGIENEIERRKSYKRKEEPVIIRTPDVQTSYELDPEDFVLTVSVNDAQVVIDNNNRMLREELDIVTNLLDEGFREEFLFNVEQLMGFLPNCNKDEAECIKNLLILALTAKNCFCGFNDKFEKTFVPYILNEVKSLLQDEIIRGAKDSVYVEVALEVSDKAMGILKASLDISQASTAQGLHG